MREVGSQPPTRITKEASMDVVAGVMVGPAEALRGLTCADCGALVKWTWRQRLERWECQHRCAFQSERVDYVARPVVFRVERADTVIEDEPDEEVVV